MNAHHDPLLLVDPFGGMAGDMFLAALLDLGDPRFTLEDLRGLVAALVPGEAELALSRVWRGSLSGAHLAVRTPESALAPHRGLADLVGLLDLAELPKRARAFTVRVLTRIAEAEGRVHDCAPEEIHFHEVGAVDTLLDVAGTGLFLARLGVRGAAVAPPLVGSGTVECAHGTMPVPAPATAELLRGRPVRTGGEGERCTPTGAAILAQLADDAGLSFGAEVGDVILERIGYGAGTRDPRVGPPNLVRVVLAGRSAGAARIDAVDEVSVNLDDMTPEEVGALVRSVRAAGALEVWTSAVAMKKDRPACILTALVRTGERDRIVDLVLAESTSFGVRWHRVERREAGRRSETLGVEGHAVRAKVRLLSDAPPGERDVFFEHDDVEALARALGLPLRVARSMALDAWRAARG